MAPATEAVAFFDFRKFNFHFDLTSLTLSQDRAITESFMDIFESLRAAILGINNSVKLFLVGLNGVSIAADILNVDIVS